MNHRRQFLAVALSALLASALCVHAQTTSPSSPTTSPRTPPGSPPPPPVNDDEDNLRYSRPQTSSPSTLSPDGLGVGSSNQQNSATGNNTTTGASSSSTLSAPSASTGASDAIGSTVNTTIQSEAQVTAVVQQIERQGPAVIQRAVTQFSDVACNEANARALITALREGTEVTLTDEDGETATFTPSSRLGYGEAYIALALASEALRQHGISGCATPEQWRSVLLGGPLAGSTSSSTTAAATSSSSATSSFPGILTLRTQGQGWGQIAQTAHVQLGTVVSRARSSLELSSESSDSALGRSSGERTKGSTSDRANSDTLGSPSGSSGATDIGSTNQNDTMPTPRPDRPSPRNPNADEKSQNATDKGANSDYRNPKARGSGKINDSAYDWEDRGDPKSNEKKKKDKKTDDDPRS